MDSRRLQRRLGDRDPKDGNNGTFFQLLRTPRQFALFPFYNTMNNEDLFGILIARPWKPAHTEPRISLAALGQSTRSLVLGRRSLPTMDLRFPGKPRSNAKGLANV
jgi:hypothetical protein